MTTNKPELVLDEFYNAEFPRHERTSCSDEDPSNASPDGFGCKRCNAIIHVRAERLQAENALLRAAIRLLCNIYVVDDYYEGQLREESLDAAVNRAINAALQPATEQQPISHDWDDQDKCRRCGDRDWYASATCTPKQQPAPDVEALLSLLSHARCNTCDGSGGLYDNHGQPHQCQWCHDRSEVLSAYRKGAKP